MQTKINPTRQMILSVKHRVHQVEAEEAGAELLEVSGVRNLPEGGGGDVIVDAVLEEVH